MTGPDDALQNPLDDLVSFPDAIVYQRQDILPSESSGWGMQLLLDLPRTIATANLDAQLTAAGFAPESASGQPGLLRFMREDAYVWGMITTTPDGRTMLLISYTSGKPEPDQL